MSERCSQERTWQIIIDKFWIHLQNLPQNNTAKQCLQILKDMADKNQPKL